MVKISAKSDVLTLKDLVALDYQASKMIRDRHPFFGRLIERVKNHSKTAAARATAEFIVSFQLSPAETKVAKGIFNLFHN